MTTLALPNHRLEDRQAAYLRVRRFSTALFVAVSLLYLVARWMEFQHVGTGMPWQILAAFAEAAMVGALADWFAVVALFRHPLGIPLPHTAIIPNNRERIAENLGAFITGNFLRTEVILQRVHDYDPGAKLAAWLSRRESAEMLAAYSTRAMAFGMRALGDERFLRFAHDTLLARLQRADFSRLAGELLDVLTQDRRHQELLDASIHHLRVLLAEEETQKKISTLIAREFDGWRRAVLGAVKLDAMIGDYSADKLVAALSRLFDEVDADAHHPLRERFDGLVAGFVARLKADPAFRSKGEEVRQRLLSSPEVTGYLRDLWAQMHDWLEADLKSPDSLVRAKMVGVTLELGEKLRADAGMRDWINDQALDIARPLCEEHRDNIGHFISAQVRAWDRDYMVQQVELNIGRDLQYIRINGTLIGGLVGLALYGLTAWLRG